MQQWEHKVETMQHLVEEGHKEEERLFDVVVTGYLDKMGNDGWRNYKIVHLGRYKYRYYFEREKP